MLHLGPIIQKKSKTKMGITKKSSGIDFRDLRIKNSFDKLKQNDPNLYKNLIRAFNDILNNAFCGIQIPKRLIPLEYNCKNLWKYNLPDAWRLLYTIKAQNKIEIISVILDWMNHKEYERRLNY